MKNQPLSVLTAVSIMVPFLTFLLKVYYLPFYGLFVLLAGYIFYERYKILPPENRKSFVITKAIPLLMIIALLAFYMLFGENLGK